MPALGAPGRIQCGVLTLVKHFKFKRNNDKGGFRWTAQSEIERPGFYGGFTAVGKTLADVKEFAALVRRCERTGKLERWNGCRRCTRLDLRNECKRHGVGVGFRTRRSRNERS